jgi:hypothetical protein
MVHCVCDACGAKADVERHAELPPSWRSVDWKVTGQRTKTPKSLGDNHDACSPACAALLLRKAADAIEAA